MTKISRDVLTHEIITVADRLKAARTEAGKTRKAVFKGTGIPASTLEKYETGNMDPNTARLQTICDFLGVSTNWVLNGDDMPSVAATKKTAEIKPSANSSETSSEPFAEGPPQQTVASSPANENDSMEHVRGMLGDLDNMRTHGFDGLQRPAMALAENILATLKCFKPGELLTLAYERGLYKDDGCLDAAGILGLFAKDLEEGQSYCGNIEERILDTAILGVDLYGIKRAPLVELADELQKDEDHGIEMPAWGGFSWGNHEDFVPLIRPLVRSIAYCKNPVNFTDQDEFPRRGE